MRFRLPSLSNLLRHLPANFFAPPRPGSAGEQYLTHEKIRASLGYFGNQVRFLPWIDGTVVDETTQMRESYRQMLREPAIKAAFFKKILCIAQLDLQVHPASDSAIDHEVAAFVSDALNGCRGGIRRIVYSILSGAVMDGYSVCEKVWQVQDRGRWKGRVTLKALKSKDTRWLELIGDTYRNVTHVRDLRTSYSYAAENFVIYAHLPMFETPLGMSDFRAAYRAYWIMDAAWKLRSILLERYTLPFLMGSYPMARKDLRPALEQSLENARAQGWVSLPEGAKIEAIQLATKGESDFKSAIQDLTSEMVLAIEGATLQTLQGTVSDGRGNSLVHQDSSQILTGFLAAEVADVLSSQLVPSLVDINIAGAAYPRLTLSSVDDGALLQSLQVDEGLQKLGLPLSKKAAYEKYSRQKPSDPDDALQTPASSFGQGVWTEGAANQHLNTSHDAEADQSVYGFADDSARGKIIPYAWREEEHPRDQQGRFTNKPDGGNPGGSSHEAHKKKLEAILRPRSYWQDLANRAIQAKSSQQRRVGFDDAAHAIERNKRITAEYARLFKADPPRFLWAGLAAMASDEVGKTLVQLRDFATPATRGDDRELQPLPASVAAHVGELLAKGNRAVYDDIAWQFIAYHEAESQEPGLGKELIDWLAKQKDQNGQSMLSQNAWQAWQRIIGGGETGISEGTVGIARIEQKEILQPLVFNDPIVKSAGEFLSKHNEPLFRGAPRFGGDGNIADFGERWKWITEKLIPSWVSYQKFKDSRTGTDNSDWKSKNNTVKNTMNRLIDNASKK